MEYAYAAADVVVARSGAMTVAELCVVGKAGNFCSLSICCGRSSNSKCDCIWLKKCSIDG